MPSIFSANWIEDEKNRNVDMADNGGGTVTQEDIDASIAKLNAQHAQNKQPEQPQAAPAPPTYNYVPGVFNQPYNYTPSAYQGGYNYEPGEFSAPYLYTPEEYQGGYKYEPGEFQGKYTFTPTQFQYNSEYTDLINAARERLTNWNYDPNKDVSYNAYKNQYTRAGQKAMRDALAQYASKTGGVASSYAASAAQQQYNNYMAQLAAKVPELEQLAYSRAADEYARGVAADQEAYNRAYNEHMAWQNMLRQQADTLYNHEWDEYRDMEDRLMQNAQYLNNFEYQQWSDWQNMLRQQADTLYGHEWDQYRDREDRLMQNAQYQNDFDYRQWYDWENMLRQQADTEYDIALQQFQMQEAAREAVAKNAYNAETSAYNAKYGGSGSGGEEKDVDFRKDSLYKAVLAEVESYIDKGDIEGASEYLGTWIGHMDLDWIEDIARLKGLSGNASSNVSSGSTEGEIAQRRDQKNNNPVKINHSENLYNAPITVTDSKGNETKTNAGTITGRNTGKRATNSKKNKYGNGSYYYNEETKQWEYK